MINHQTFSVTCKIIRELKKIDFINACQNVTKRCETAKVKHNKDLKLGTKILQIKNESYNIKVSLLSIMHESMHMLRNRLLKRELENILFTISYSFT